MQTTEKSVGKEKEVNGGTLVRSTTKMVEGMREKESYSLESKEQEQAALMEQSSTMNINRQILRRIKGMVPRNKILKSKKH